MEKEREAFEAAYIEDDRSNSVDCVDGRYSDGDTREAWHWFSAGVNYALTQPQSGDDKWEDVHLRVYKDDQYKGPGHKCISYKGVIYRPESNPQAGEVVESEHDRIICEREEWPDYTLTEGKPDHATNLAMLVKRIAYRHSKGLPLDETIAGAMEYLQRENLQGSPLREGKPDGVDVELVNRIDEMIVWQSARWPIGWGSVVNLLVDVKAALTKPTQGEK